MIKAFQSSEHPAIAQQDSFKAISDTGTLEENNTITTT
jgi:hypothetical protein